MPAPKSRGADFWNSSMGHAWVSQQAAISDVFTSVTSVSFNAAAAKPGEYVVDIGCGTGDTLLEFAEVVGPSGAVLGVDVSVPMLDFARHRAAEAGYSNVSCALADATTYAFERRRADLVYSRFGVMFFDDPAAAFANLRTALRSSGRLCFLCWQPLEKNEWARVPFLAATRHVQPPAPPAPDAPGPFAFANPDRVRHLLEAGGFKDVSCESYEAELSMGGARTVDEAVEFSLELGPLARLLGDAGMDLRTRVAQAVREALTPYMSQHGVSLRGAAWIVLARPQ